MSTNVTIAVAEPNHLPIEVAVQIRAKSDKASIWIDESRKIIRVGQAQTFMVYDGKRLIIEEVPGSTS